MVIEMTDHRNEQHFIVLVDGVQRLFTETNLRIFIQQVIAAGVSDEDFELHLEALSDPVQFIEVKEVA